MTAVLLAAVNSQYIHSNPALYALTRSAEAAGCGNLLETADYSINMPVLRVMEDIYRRRPEVLAFSVYIWNSDYLQALAADLRLLLPETLILLGGPEAAMRPDYYLAALSADGVCIGEGEAVFADFLRCYQAGERCPGLPGLLWKGREADYTPAAGPDLARLPFLYTQADGELLKAGKKVIYYEASRGCPFACAFCASAKEPLRERPLGMVLAELPCLAEWGVQIKFVDRTFNAQPKRAAAIVQAALDLYRPGLSWHFEVSPFNLDAELVRLWLSAPPDYFHLEIGVQTLSQPALAAIGRRGDWRQAEPVVQDLIRQGNCHVHLDLIAGLPQDTPAGFAAAFHQLHQLNPDYLQLGFLKVLPGSRLAEQAGALGLKAERQPPYRILATPEMDADYLFSLFRAERIFNALYNKAEFRPALLAAAERQPGGALGLYFRGAALHPGVAGLSQRDKLELLAELCGKAD